MKEDGILDNRGKYIEMECSSMSVCFIFIFYILFLGVLCVYVYIFFIKYQRINLHYLSALI